MVLHILAGGLGIVSGFAALSVTKGGTLHRRVGTVFVCVILAMAGSGLLMSVLRGVTTAINVPAALVTAYLVGTALVTVRPQFPGSRWISVGAMVLALTIGPVSLTFGFEAVLNGQLWRMCFALFIAAMSWVSRTSCPSRSASPGSSPCRY